MKISLSYSEAKSLLDNSTPVFLAVAEDYPATQELLAPGRTEEFRQRVVDGITKVMLNDLPLGLPFKVQLVD